MSNIEWTETTWNPVVGCRRVSEGCRNCYAERMAARIVHMGGQAAERYRPVVKIDEAGAPRPAWNGEVRTVPEVLDRPLRWRRPRMVFVNSMSDLFHPGVPFDFIAAVFGVMAAPKQHTFQILTKRPERAVEFFRWLEQRADSPGRLSDDPRRRRGDVLMSAAHRAGVSQTRGRPGVYTTAANVWPLPNVWLGVSVEDQPTADERIPLLLQCPAAVRFVSYEPALGPVDFAAWLPRHAVTEAGDCAEWCKACGPDGPVRGLDWIIVGGESGPRARRFDLEWARTTVGACREAGVPVFVKQLGSRPVEPVRSLPGATRAWVHWRLRDRKGGDLGEWPPELRVREMPERKRA